jgi:hypothetical protein
VHFEWKDGCTEQQKTTVIHSWQDAVLLASAAWNSGIDAKTNWAATDFFGPPVYSEKWRDRTLAVYKEIGLTSATFSNPSHHPNTLNINVYCNLSSDEQRGPEWSHTCSLRDEEGKKVPVGIKKPGEPTYQVNWLIGAFTWNTENQDGSGQKQKTSQFFGNMQLCPRFWAVYTKSLQDVIEDHAYSGRRKVKFNLDNYGNKGRFATESNLLYKASC